VAVARHEPRSRPAAGPSTQASSAAPTPTPAASPARSKAAAPKGGPIAIEPAGPVSVQRGSSAPYWQQYMESAHPAQWHAARNSTLGGNSWALLVGINDYAPPTRDNVGSYQDATSLQQYLQHLGWHADHILLIGNTDATRSHVIAGLDWLASKTDSSSLVVFHYSGHEKPFNFDSNGVPSHIALWLSDNATLLDTDLGNLLNPVRGSRMWLDFAVCRAGGFDDPGTIKAGRLLTYSSPKTELSYEDPDVSHSVFGYYSIVQGMQSADADSNGDGVVTVQEAFSYAQPRVESRTNNQQHPLMVDDYGSGFSLVPPAPPPPPPPPPQPTPQQTQSSCALIVCPKQ